MADSLRASCKQILQRLQQKDLLEFSCILCSRLFRGQDTLMDHLITEHDVHCFHFDNVIDLHGLLQHLSAVLHGGSGSAKQWSCPVCGEDIESEKVEVLLDHVRSTGHNYWNPRTIPSMASWCVAPISGPAGSAPSSSGNLGAAQNHAKDDDFDCEWSLEEEVEEEVDEEEDWGLECVCLYCDYSGEDILQHMHVNHSFDFRLRVQQRTDCRDEYDLIRMANMVRRAICSRRCPYGEECSVEGDQTILEAHFLAHQEHRLPKHLSTGQIDLIPVLPGDAFISMLVTSGAGFLQTEEADPEFPMVPTVQELALAASRSSHK